MPFYKAKNFVLGSKGIFSLEILYIEHKKASGKVCISLILIFELFLFEFLLLANLIYLLHMVVEIILLLNQKTKFNGNIDLCDEKKN